jgi:hypothetical protein
VRLWGVKTKANLHCGGNRTPPRSTARTGPRAGGHLTARCSGFVRLGSPVFGRLHRQGRLRLILVLPDGSRSLVAADWTDLLGRQAVATGERSTRAALLGTVADLLLWGCEGGRP